MDEKLLNEETLENVTGGAAGMIAAVYSSGHANAGGFTAQHPAPTPAPGVAVYADLKAPAPADAALKSTAEPK